MNCNDEQEPIEYVYLPTEMQDILRNMDVDTSRELMYEIKQAVQENANFCDIAESMELEGMSFKLSFCRRKTPTL